MQPQQNFSRLKSRARPGAIDWHLLARLAVIAAIALPAVAMAADTSGDAEQAICNLMGTVQNVLTGIAVVVVTVAVIFAGYQIAFAHKRIAEVAPVLIGGVMIGAAAQIATTLMKFSNYSACTPQASIAPDTLTQLASIAHSVVGYLA